jgi:hypothetical protein
MTAFGNGPVQRSGIKFHSDASVEDMQWILYHAEIISVRTRSFMSPLSIESVQNDQQLTILLGKSYKIRIFQDDAACLAGCFVLRVIVYDIHVAEQTMKWSIKMTDRQTDWALTSVPLALLAECWLVNSWLSDCTAGLKRTPPPPPVHIGLVIRSLKLNGVCVSCYWQP